MLAPSFLEVQLKWYSTLAQLGFKDIENVKNIDGPMAGRESVKIGKPIESSGLQSSWPEGRFWRQEELFSRPDLVELLAGICIHKTNKSSLKVDHLKRILELQIDGFSSRAIGLKMRLCYRTIQRAENKMLELAMIIETR